MQRSAINYLKNWKDKSNRKPLVLRGARQVGKSYLVKMFADECFSNFIELNFEKKPELASLFKSNDPQKIITSLEIEFETTITDGETLLFLDEIQATPQVFTSLRYFYEEKPAIHLIAAGSLLEFVLEAPDFSVPVGRLEYMFLGPMTFEEFLLALNKKKLLNFLEKFDFDEDIPESIHNKLLEYVRIFFVIGGMPASINAYIGNMFAGSEQEKQSIINTYYDDFGKYKRRVSPERLRKIFDKVPRLIGQKFKYVNIDPQDQARNISYALNLLCEAGVVHKVHHTSSNGVPLRAEINELVFKPLFLDVGLLSSCCGLNLLHFEQQDDLTQINQGAVCEQFVGQHLLYLNDYYIKPELYYWAKEKKSSNAEVDYVSSHGDKIFPIEVKSGKTGRLKSMQVFLQTKKRNFAIRINNQLPSIHNAKYAIMHQKDDSFRFVSIPFYLICQFKRIVNTELLF